MGGKAKKEKEPHQHLHAPHTYTRKEKKREKYTPYIQTKRRKLAAGTSRLLTTELHTLYIGLTDSHSILTPRNSIRMPPLDHSGLLKTQSTRAEKAFIFRLQRFIELFSGIIALAIKRGLKPRAIWTRLLGSQILFCFFLFFLPLRLSSRPPATL